MGSGGGNGVRLAVVEGGNGVRLVDGMGSGLRLLNYYDTYLSWHANHEFITLPRSTTSSCGATPVRIFSLTMMTGAASFCCYRKGETGVRGKLGKLGSGLRLLNTRT